jgi:target of EGR1 protein 1
VRYLFRQVLYEVNRLKIPIVIHNGLMDLMYLYFSMFTDLPANLPIFTADLSDMFPGGIIDTKYISDYVSKEPVSFLSYLYKKYEREQKRRKAIKENEDSSSKEKFVRRYFTLDVQPPIPIDTLNMNELKRTLKFTSAEDEVNRSAKTKKRRRRNQRVVTREEKPYCEQYAVSKFCYRHVASYCTLT